MIAENSGFDAVMCLLPKKSRVLTWEKGRRMNMEIAEARKLKVELETEILVLLREFTAKTGIKTERIELIKVIQAKVGMGEYSEVISVEVKMTL